MKKIYFLLMVGFFSLLQANKYDYLLFSNVYSDVRRGVELGADVNARLRGSTPLYDASRKGNMDSVYLLLNRRADVSAKSHGETALHKVVQARNLRIAQALLEAGANPNTKDDLKGNTSVHYAVYNGDMAMVSLLMNYGGDMDRENKNGDTPARFILSRINVPPLSIQNDDIALTSSAFRVGSGGVAFNIRNLTDEFVTVYYSALYINGDLISERELSRTIPPNSTAQSVGNLAISPNAFKSISVKTSGEAKVKYGFGIEYSVGNRKNSLYDNSSIILQVWNPPKRYK